MIKLLWLLSTLTNICQSPKDSLKFKQEGLKFELYCRDKCQDTTGINIRYYFKAVNGTVKFKVNPQTGICYLPSKGLYKLYLMEFEYPLTYRFDGQEKDTINFPEVYFGVSTATDVNYSNYMKCNDVANGNIIDWFKENRKRCEGKFKKGRLIGKLVFYDLNGNVVKVETDPRTKRK